MTIDILANCKLEETQEKTLSEILAPLWTKPGDPFRVDKTLEVECGLVERFKRSTHYDSGETAGDEWVPARRTSRKLCKSTYDGGGISEWHKGKKVGDYSSMLVAFDTSPDGQLIFKHDQIPTEVKSARKVNGAYVNRDFRAPPRTPSLAARQSAIYERKVVEIGFPMETVTKGHKGKNFRRSCEVGE